MDIRTIIRFGALVSMILIFSLGSIMVISAQQISAEIERERTAEKIVEGVVELNILTSDYLLHPEERAEAQWELRHGSLTELLLVGELKSPNGREIMQDILQNHEIIGDMFSEIRTAGIQNTDQRVRLAGQISIRSQSMVSDAIQLAESSREVVALAQQRADIFGMLAVVILAGSTSVNFWGLSRQISTPIRNLTREMEEVSHGNLESNIGRESDDELGRLLLKVRNNLRRLLGERTKAIVDLKKSNDLLEKSNKALESYSYAVSHDLKAPVRSMQSFSSFLLEDYCSKLDETGMDYVKRIAASASRMDTLIQSLLTLSRVGRDSSEIEAVDLNDILDEIVADLDIKGKVEVLNKLPTVHIQRTWIKQLFLNLISNGLKFNKAEVPRIEVYSEQRSEDHLFGVRDNGIGIERKYWKRIFELFQGLHGKEQYEGVGAGLAISKKIVDEIGGRIWVESVAGDHGGSTFHFTIPRTRKS